MEQPASLAAALADPAGQKAQRQRSLLAALHGRRGQTRDDRGRFAGGFDGGARQLVPTKGPPDAEHNAWIVDRVIESRAHRGPGW
jgi:hypothetical protein